MFSGLLSGLSGLTLGGGSVWEAKLLGRINIAYSLEPNYFTYRTIKKSRSALEEQADGLSADRSGATSAADASAVSPEKKVPEVDRGPLAVHVFLPRAAAARVCSARGGAATSRRSA